MEVGGRLVEVGGRAVGVGGGRVEVGGRLVMVGGKSVGEGFGAVEQETLKNRLKTKKMEYATRDNFPVLRVPSGVMVGLNFKRNFTNVRIGFFGIEQARAQMEFTALLSSADVQGEDVFAAHRFDHTGRGNFIAVCAVQVDFDVGPLLEGGHFHVDAGPQRAIVEHGFGAQFEKTHLIGRDGEVLPIGGEFGKKEIYVFGHEAIIQ